MTNLTQDEVLALIQKHAGSIARRWDQDPKVLCRDIRWYITRMDELVEELHRLLLLEESNG